MSTQCTACAMSTQCTACGDDEEVVYTDWNWDKTERGKLCRWCLHVVWTSECPRHLRKVAMYIEDAQLALEANEESSQASEFTIDSPDEDDNNINVPPARVVNVPIAVATIGKPLISEPAD